MGIPVAVRIGGIAAIGIGSAITLAACGRSSTPTDGPMSELTIQIFERLDPGSSRGAKQLDVTRQAVREVLRDDGSSRGAYDGTRLLRAADAHAYGTPTIGDPVRDVKGDGMATFNEVRHVVRQFDLDASNGFDSDEKVAFQAAVGVEWRVPAG